MLSEIFLGSLCSAECQHVSSFERQSHQINLTFDDPDCTQRRCAYYGHTPGSVVCDAQI